MRNMFRRRKLDMGWSHRIIELSDKYRRGHGEVSELIALFEECAVAKLFAVASSPQPNMSLKQWDTLISSLEALRAQTQPDALRTAVNGCIDVAYSVWKEIGEPLAVASSQTQEPPRHEACPCLHTTPCHPNCTCVVSVSSRGCARCCSYGSKEQQRTAAERLAGSPQPPCSHRWVKHMIIAEETDEPIGIRVCAKCRFYEPLNVSPMSPQEQNNE